ncbi:MAG: nitroreductase family protein [Candidatus Thermoplasmatota archaeon]
MDIKEAIRERHSVRRFTDKTIPIKLIEELIEYANLAPSAGNLQAREFIVIDDHKIKEELAIASLNQSFIVQAPVNIVVCANLERISSYGKRGREVYALQDAAAAIEHILLLVTSYGLGACWVGAFDENEVSNILNLPSYIRPMAIIPIGYPEGMIEKTSRIKPERLTHYNRW